MDSILIQNLTQGGDTTLYGTDTVLVLDHGIGIDDKVNAHGNQMILFPAFPNPVTHTSTIRLWLPQDEPVTIRLYDLVGRELATFTRSLGGGEHIFTFTPGKETCYLLVAKAANERQVQKIINLSPGDGNCRLSYAGHQPAVSGMNRGIAVLPWVPGDSLKITGYISTSSNYPIVLFYEDNPLQSSKYSFRFFLNIPCPGMPTVMDYDGNIYNTVRIGDQCWMKENLKVGNYSNGIPIPNITVHATWGSLSTGSMCWFNNDSASYANTYGALYNWYAVDNPNGLCPTGWHVPTDSDFIILTDYLGGYKVAGGHLKAQSFWYSPNTGATNLSGFTGLPGGERDTPWGSFASVGNYGNLWSSSEYSATFVWFQILDYKSSNFFRIYAHKSFGFSVLCIKD